jgi:hypothetical protein
MIDCPFFIRFFKFVLSKDQGSGLFIIIVFLIYKAANLFHLIYQNFLIYYCLKNFTKKDDYLSHFLEKIFFKFRFLFLFLEPF